MFTYEYPRPALTVDCLVFGLDEHELQLLLIKRGQDPFHGGWALPGGFVHVDETLETAARRELAEETGMTKVYLEQLAAFGAVDRDPRERVVTIAWFALVNLEEHRLQADTDASDAAWFGIHDLPTLAFDHTNIVESGLARLKQRIRRAPVGFELLPETFPLSRLRHLYEIVLERPLDKRNFRKKVLNMDLLIETDMVEQDVSHRAARLYRFDLQRYEALSQQGFNFEI
jgi:8-oxo-dGTP diphosphatase